MFHFFDSSVIKQIVLVSTLLHKSFYFISTISISDAQRSVKSNVNLEES